jgi:hypothetical protein
MTDPTIAERSETEALLGAAKVLLEEARYNLELVAQQLKKAEDQIARSERPPPSAPTPSSVSTPRTPRKSA